MANPVTELMEQINDQVRNLSVTSLPAITGVLDAAEVELTRALSAWKALGKGMDRFTPQMYSNALVQIRGALETIRGKLAEGVASSLRHGGELAAHLATKHLIQTVSDMSALFQGTVRPIPIEAATVLADGKALVWKRFSNSAKRYAGQVGEDIKKQLAIGVVRGETIDQLTNRLMMLGGPKGIVYTRGQEGSPGARAEMISEGLFRRYRHFADRLAVTETVNAYNEFALVGMDELEEHDPGYFKKWDAAIDKRTCPNCRQYDDLIAPMDKPFKGGIDHPPLHPYCRCATVVWRKEWKEGNYKDDLVGETIKGSGVGGVRSVPHRMDVPKKPKEPKETKAPKVVKAVKPKPEPVKKPEPIKPIPVPWGSPKTEPAKKAPATIPTSPLPWNNVKPKPVPVVEAPKPVVPKVEPVAPKTEPEAPNKDKYQNDQARFYTKNTRETNNALYSYQGSNYIDINGHLRGTLTEDMKGQDTKQTKKEIKLISDAIQNNPAAPLKEKITVYRGMNHEAAKLIPDDVKPGHIYEDKGFLSTTISKDVTKSFGGRFTTMHIEVPKGAHAALISPHHSEEYEYLFQKGTKLEIISVEHTPEGGRIIHARMIPADKPQKKKKKSDE